MDKKLILEVLKKAKESSNKRKFKQSVDFIVGFKGLDLKKQDNQMDFFVTLHHPTGKKKKVCALVGPELLEQGKEVCDLAINVDDFGKYDKKQIKKLSKGYDFFIAQANIMPKVAASFGRILGPIGKMPNPKAGCVVPPGANLKPLYEKLQKTIRVSVKKDPLFQCLVGMEDGNEEEVADNILDVYNSIVSNLPSQHNIKRMYLKLTMGPSVRFGGKEKKVKGKEEERKPEVGGKKPESSEKESKKEKPTEKEKKEKPIEKEKEGGREEEEEKSLEK